MSYNLCPVCWDISNGHDVVQTQSNTELHDLAGRISQCVHWAKKSVEPRGECLHKTQYIVHSTCYIDIVHTTYFILRSVHVEMSATGFAVSCVFDLFTDVWKYRMKF